MSILFGKPFTEPESMEQKICKKKRYMAKKIRRISKVPPTKFTQSPEIINLNMPMFWLVILIHVEFRIILRNGREFLSNRKGWAEYPWYSFNFDHCIIIPFRPSLFQKSKFSPPGCSPPALSKVYKHVICSRPVNSTV